MRLAPRNNLRAAERLLSQLLAQEPCEPDVVFEMHVFELELLMRQGSYPIALEKLEHMISTVNDEDADVLTRLRLLILKAQLFSRCGVPLKSFSAAMRATSVAWRARLLPALWEALMAVANILLHLREFEAAAKLLHAILPQVSSRSSSLFCGATWVL